MSGLPPVSSSRKNSKIFPVPVSVIDTYKKWAQRFVQRPLTPFPLSKYHASFPLSIQKRYIGFAAEIRLFPVFLFFGGSIVLGCVDGIRPGIFGL